MDLIDQLIADSKAAVEKARQAKRKAPTTDIDDFAKRELELEPTRLIALFHHIHCAHCDSLRTEFDGLFEERYNARLHEKHWTRLPLLPEAVNLPREREYMVQKVPFCEKCVDVESYRDPQA